MRIFLQKKQWGAASIAGRFSKQPEYNTVNEIGLSKIEIGLGTQLGRFGKKMDSENGYSIKVFGCVGKKEEKKHIVAFFFLFLSRSRNTPFPFLILSSFFSNYFQKLKLKFQRSNKPTSKRKQGTLPLFFWIENGRLLLGFTFPAPFLFFLVSPFQFWTFDSLWFDCSLRCCCWLMLEPVHAFLYLGSAIHLCFDSDLLTFQACTLDSTLDCCALVYVDFGIWLWYKLKFEHGFFVCWYW